MPNIQELTRMLKELDDQLVGCMKCGMCQAVCPLFAETGREADVTRGKISLLSALSDELLTDPKGVKERLDRCLLCGTCEANCPSGVKVLNIFLKARAILTGYFGLPKAQQLIFRQVMTRPKLFNNLLAMGSKMQGLFSKPANAVIGTSCSRFAAPVIADRHFPSLAKKPFHEEFPSLDEPAGTSGLRVAFFPGCVMDKIFPHVAKAAVKALRHHGVGIYMPEGQQCCGIPALSCGDRDSFDAYLRANADLFAGKEFDYILTCCASCTATIHELWPSMASSPAMAKAIKPVSAKAMDISQFLVDVLGVKALEPAEKATTVTYHDPCHLKNSMGITAQPRTLVNASSGHTMKEMNEAGVCCGCGGSFNVKHYDLSKKIGENKADNIIDTGADVVATACPACMMQIGDQLSQKNASKPVRHVIEIYAESLD